MLAAAIFASLCVITSSQTYPPSFDTVTTVNGHDIGWVQVFSCPEASGGSVQTFANGLNGANYFDYFKNVISVQILPIGTTPDNYNFDASETNPFAVMIDVCSNPIVALNNNLDLSWPIDSITLKHYNAIADLAYINDNYLGSSTATARYVQGSPICTCPAREPSKIYDSTYTDPDYYVYWACCNHGGVHITRTQCSLDYQTNLPGIDGIGLWFGFDNDKKECCNVDSNGDVGLAECPFDPAECPYVYTNDGVPRTYKEAKAFCGLEGLATIVTQEDFDCARNLVNGPPAWIGLQSIDDEIYDGGDFTYIDGTECRVKFNGKYGQCVPSLWWQYKGKNGGHEGRPRCPHNYENGKECVNINNIYIDNDGDCDSTYYAVLCNAIQPF